MGRINNETKHSAGCGLCVGERQTQIPARRVEGEIQKLPKSGLGHADLVVGDRQAAFGYVKYPLCRPAVTAWVVQNALLDTIGTEDARDKFIAVHRQREQPRQAGTIQHKRSERQLCDRRILQIIVEKILNPLVGRAKVIGQQPLFFPVLSNQRGDNVAQLRCLAGRHRRKAQQREFDVNAGNQTVG